MESNGNGLETKRYGTERNTSSRSRAFHAFGSSNQNLKVKKYLTRKKKMKKKKQKQEEQQAEENVKKKKMKHLRCQ